MGWMRRLRNLFKREQIESEIEAELRAHLEMAVEDGVRAGMSEDEARREARVRFGNPVVVRERTLGADTALWVEGLWRDVKFALRQMKKSPGFAATAVLTLALGIGATTAMFTVVDNALLRPLPYRNPGRLVFVDETGSAGVNSFGVPYLDFRQWRGENHAFQSMAYYVQCRQAYLSGRTGKRAGSAHMDA